MSKTREAVQVSSKSDRRLNDASFEENSKARRQLKVFIAGVAPIKKYLERGLRSGLLRFNGFKVRVCLKFSPKSPRNRGSQFVRPSASS